MAMLKSEKRCDCGECQVSVSLPELSQVLTPRICDCDYCQRHPALVVSDPEMVISVIGSQYSIEKNGDKLASFYRCDSCKQLLVVGCNINGVLRGSVNVALLENSDWLGEPVSIKPYRLNRQEKLERWHQLWGVLVVDKT